MRKMLVAGNWKMNGSQESVRELTKGILAQANTVESVDLAVFPPAIYLPYVAELLAGSNIAWGAQNVADRENGAFTGEISATMLQDFGCHYAIVGHSERRLIYQESNELVTARFKMALQHDLRTILCVGETKEQREQGLTLKIVQEQLAKALSLTDNLPAIDKMVIAYEPVWAIGTGLTATPQQAQDVHVAIRQQIASIDAKLATRVRILYGGSVKPENASELFSMPDIDGALVGGASLDPNKFVEIAKQCNK
jgi:triosephosphate isomerase (TIM)